MKPKVVKTKSTGFIVSPEMKTVLTLAKDPKETFLSKGVPSDLKKALKANPKAETVWKDVTPKARRDWIIWVISGKLKETRQIRIDTACSKFSSGMRRPCCFPGINWLLKNN